MLKKKLCCFKTISIFVFAMIIISGNIFAPTTPTKQEIEVLIKQVNDQLEALEAKFNEILRAHGPSASPRARSASAPPTTPPPPPKTPTTLRS